jgi:hypothetical protein
MILRVGETDLSVSGPEFDTIQSLPFLQLNRINPDCYLVTGFDSIPDSSPFFYLRTLSDLVHRIAPGAPNTGKEFDSVCLTHFISPDFECFRSFFDELFQRFILSEIEKRSFQNALNGILNEVQKNVESIEKEEEEIPLKVQAAAVRQDWLLEVKRQVELEAKRKSLEDEVKDFTQLRQDWMGQIKAQRNKFVGHKARDQVERQEFRKVSDLLWMVDQGNYFPTG